MSKQEIGIVDTRNILKSISERHDLDFKNHALTFFKRRLEHILDTYRLRGPDVLVDKIKNDPEFFEFFLKEVCIETTELFRDPSLWRYLKDKFLPGLLRGANRFKIWFPEVSSGEELYSLAILLNEMGHLDKVRFVVGSISQLRLDELQKGLEDKGVGSAIHYPRPLHKQPIFEKKYGIVRHEKYCYYAIFFMKIKK